MYFCFYNFSMWLFGFGMVLVRFENACVAQGRLLKRCFACRLCNCRRLVVHFNRTNSVCCWFHDILYLKWLVFGAFMSEKRSDRQRYTHLLSGHFELSIVWITIMNWYLLMRKTKGKKPTINKIDIEKWKKICQTKMSACSMAFYGRKWFLRIR